MRKSFPLGSFFRCLYGRRMTMSDTIAAIATGAQVAAIGIIRLSGPQRRRTHV